MPNILETVIAQLPSLAGLVVLSWYLLTRLKACEEARETLSKEHTDLLVRVAKLETQVNGGHTNV